MRFTPARDRRRAVDGRRIQRVRERDPTIGRTKHAWWQKELASLLKRKQAAISRLERRSDIHVSTLRDFIAALGGRLELIATFPDGSYHIKQLEQE